MVRQDKSSATCFAKVFPDGAISSGLCFYNSSASPMEDLKINLP
jgi:hypothetical protein